jgi:preprotein translocase subunit YajC
LAPQLILVVAMLILLWVLLIRPQRTRQRQQTELLSSIEPGDEILTVGGLYGIVQEIDEDDDLVVEVADGIHVRIARRAVAGLVKPEHEGDEDDETEEGGGSEPGEAPEAASGEDGVNDSEDFVSDDQAESPAAVERR